MQSGIQFDGDQFRMQTLSSLPEAPKMVKWLMKIGLAKTEKQAMNLWIIFIVVVIIVSIYLAAFYGNTGDDRTKLILEQNRINIEEGK